MKKRIASIVTALALALALLPGAAPRARAASFTATDQASFEDAMNRAGPGDIIQVDGSIVLRNPLSNNDSLVINKAVTIQGGSLTFWYAGVLLGADVTFRNITLGLASNVRNALMANGHKLTLENVKKASGMRDIHLFCGGLTGSSQESVTPGGHGEILIQGSTDLGNANIYAGSISTDGGANLFDGSAAVTIDESVRSLHVHHLYACGALETYTSENDWFDYTREIAPPTPNSARFQTGGNVVFRLSGTAVQEADGDTGTGYADVVYNGDNNLNENLILRGTGSLSVESGYLIPAGGSSFIDDSIPLTVHGGATLGLKNLGRAVSIGSFTGGGNLVLNEDQTLTVNGAVSGTTTVAVGTLFNGHSLAVPAAGSVYIDAPQSQEGDFVLAPNAANPDIALVYQTGGTWEAMGGQKSDKTIVNDFTLLSAVAEPEETNGYLPIQNASFTANSAREYVAAIPLEISVSIAGAAFADTTRNDDGHAYSYTLGNLYLQIASGDTPDEEVVEILYQDSSPLTGSYTVSITVPAEYSGTGRSITRTAALTVKAADGQATPIPVPTARTGLVYTGDEQSGVPQGDGYTLSGDSAIDADTYTATATLDGGFVWSNNPDGPESGASITWSIARAENPDIPTGLTGEAPSVSGGRDGKINGTSPAMEYAANASFSGARDCDDGETSVSSGSYYVRVKASRNYNAGPAVMVTVPEGAAPTVRSIRISSTTHKIRYQVGEALDVENLTLTVTMSNGSSYTLPVAAGMVRGFDSSALAESQTLTVSYGGQEATYTITITESGGGETGGGNTGGSTGGSSGGGSSSGGSSGGSSSDSGSSSSSSSVTNPDGSVTTTTTDRTTGTVTTTTTRRKDGSATVVEARKDGTVTIRETAKNGVRVETVNKPGEDITARVTVPSNVRTAAVTIPRDVTSGTVAVDSRTGEVVKLSVPTEEGMLVKLDASANLVLEDRSRSFADTGNHWAGDAIDFVTARGLFQGTSATAFSPDKTMTRGMIAVVLHNLEGNPDAAAQGSFSDVKPGDWCAGGVRWMLEMGITGGYANGSFGTNDPITREQLVTFLYRYANAMGYRTGGGYGALSGFRDGAEVSGYAVEAMRWAVGSGLISGFENGSLAPQGRASRAQVASILQQFVICLTK